MILPLKVTSKRLIYQAFQQLVMSLFDKRRIVVNSTQDLLPKIQTFLDT